MKDILKTATLFTLSILLTAALNGWSAPGQKEITACLFQQGENLSESYIQMMMKEGIYPPRTNFDGLLGRIRDAGYDYIIAEFAPVAWDWKKDGWIFYNDAVKGHHFPKPQSRVETIKEAFEKVDSYGMRLIPLIQIQSKHATSWQHVNSSLEMNEVVTQSGDTVRIPLLRSDNPRVKGIDYYFGQYLKRVNDEFEAAKLSAGFPDYVEHIFIGYDEFCVPLNGKFMPITNKADMMRIEEIAESIDGRKKQEQAVRQLYVEALSRRFGIVKEMVDERTKVSIFGDMFTPVHNGNPQCRYVNYKGEEVKVRFAPHQYKQQESIIALPGLTKSEKETLHRDLIIFPWFGYSNKIRGREYDPTDMFDYCKDAGFENLAVFWQIGTEYIQSDGSLRHEIEIRQSKVDALRKIAKAYRNIDRPYRFGYGVGVWPCWYDRQYIQYRRRHDDSCYSCIKPDSCEKYDVCECGDPSNWSNPGTWHDSSTGDNYRYWDEIAPEPACQRCAGPMGWNFTQDRYSQVYEWNTIEFVPAYFRWYTSDEHTLTIGDVNSVLSGPQISELKLSGLCEGDVWGKFDDLGYALARVDATENFGLRARIKNMGDALKAGIMIRKSLDPRSENIFLHLNNSKEHRSVIVSQRKRFKGPTVNVSSFPFDSANKNVEFRMTREGNEILCSVMNSGSEFREITRSTTFTGNERLFVGMAMSATEGKYTEVEFDNVYFGSTESSD